MVWTQESYHKQLKHYRPAYSLDDGAASISYESISAI